jgi:hypothetical protein
MAPSEAPEEFSTAVHGTVFAARSQVVDRLQEGESVVLIPDPPGAEVPAVWVHAHGGDVVGHVPQQVAAWLAPWMLGGGRCQASVESVAGAEVASWRRLVIRVRCGQRPLDNL